MPQGLMALSALLTHDLASRYWDAPPSATGGGGGHLAGGGGHLAGGGGQPGGGKLSPSRLLLLSRVSTVGTCALLVLISTAEITLVGLAALQQQILSQARTPAHTLNPRTPAHTLAHTLQSLHTPSHTLAHPHPGHTHG